MLFCMSNLSLGQNTRPPLPPDPYTDEEPSIFIYDGNLVDTRPIFINPDSTEKQGYIEFNKYIGSHLVSYLQDHPLPKDSSNTGGIYWLQFIVNHEGKTEDVKIVRGADLSTKFEEYLISLFYAITWIPAKHNGTSAKVKMILPVRVKLNP